MRTIPDNEFVLITKGRGKVIIAGKTYEACQGILFYFYPGVLHEIESDPDNPLAFLAIHFSFAHVSYSDNLWSIDGGNKKLSFKSVIHVRPYIKLKLVLKEIVDYWNSKIPGYELVCNGLFQQFLFELIKSKSEEFNYSTIEKVKKVMEYISKNLDKKLTVQALAELIKLSPDYLSVAFKNYTGYPVTKYINKCRINSAKKIFYGGNRKIKDVALSLGFSDEFHFSKVFKKYEGISPSEFCKRIADTGI
ncbi:MAG: AraC family transcriptional regulator [Clostridiaceae bacterium]|nr:AraC family transcriptional regulator [Clostridiaceae bacterium]